VSYQLHTLTNWTTFVTVITLLLAASLKWEGHAKWIYFTIFSMLTLAVCTAWQLRMMEKKTIQTPFKEANIQTQPAKINKKLANHAPPTLEKKIASKQKEEPIVIIREVPLTQQPDPQHIKIIETIGNSFFLNPPYENLQAALQKASEKNMPAFVVIYDSDHPTRSKINYSLGYFMEYQTTKRLVNEFFVPAVVPVTQANTRKFIPEDDPLENCRLVIIRPDGHILLSEGVYANPDEGLKRVRNVITKIVGPGR
jgi:hypothetical protein